MPGLMGYGSDKSMFLKDMKDQGEQTSQQGPINVLATITPDSLTRMMQKIGGGVGEGTQAPVGGNPSGAMGQSPSGGINKGGDVPLAQQTKFLGFNKEGNNSTAATVFTLGGNRLIDKAIF